MNYTKKTRGPAAVESPQANAWCGPRGSGANAWERLNIETEEFCGTSPLNMISECAAFMHEYDKTRGPAERKMALLRFYMKQGCLIQIKLVV